METSGQIYVPADSRFETRIGEPQSRSGCYEKKKNLCPFRESKPNYSLVNLVV
jgi:hypothetical protein